MFELVVRKLKPDNWDLSFVRGEAMVPAIELADIAKYLRIKARLERAYADGELRYYSKMPLARFVHAKERLSTRTVLKTLETGIFQKTPCYAGALSAVISEEGDVYPCELLNRKIGNLRDARYGFKTLRAAKEARSIRTFVRERADASAPTNATRRSNCISILPRVRGSAAKCCVKPRDSR